MAEKKIKSQKSKVESVEKTAVKVAVKKTTTKKTDAVTEVSASAKQKSVDQSMKKGTIGQKKDALHADVYDLTGKIVESLALPGKIFGVKSNPQLVAQAARVYLANQRAGSASTKTRGEVDGSTRKIYRQKGTGRARHGGVRAPIFVHGGIAHGPKPRDFSLDMPKKMKKIALFTVLSDKARRGKVKVFDGLEKIAPKTKEMAALLEKVQDMKKKNKVLLVLDVKHANVVRAVRNIEGVTYDYARQLHAYEVLNHDAIFFMKSALNEMEKSLNNEKKQEKE